MLACKQSCAKISAPSRPNTTKQQAGRQDLACSWFLLETSVAGTGHKYTKHVLLLLYKILIVFTCNAATQSNNEECSIVADLQYIQNTDLSNNGSAWKLAVVRNLVIINVYKNPNIARRNQMRSFRLQQNSEAINSLITDACLIICELQEMTFHILSAPALP